MEILTIICLNQELPVCFKNNGIIMIKKIALLGCLVCSPIRAMQTESLSTFHGLPTLSDFATNTLVKQLLKMNTTDMASRLDKMPPAQQELLKNLLNKYYSLQPKVELKRFLSGKAGWINRAIAFSSDGRLALIGSYDGTVRLWNLTKNPMTCVKLEGHTQQIQSVAFSHDNEFALTGSNDSTARVWNLTTSPISHRVLKGHNDAVTCAAFSPNGRCALTGSLDTTARLWDLTKTAVTCQELTRYTQGIESVVFNPDGYLALTLSYDSCLRLWDLTSPSIELKEQTHTVTAAQFSPDGRFGLVGLNDITAQLYDLTQSPISSHELKGHKGYIRSIAFSPDGRFALTGSSENNAHLWDLTKVPLVPSYELVGHNDWLKWVTFSPDGRFALTTSDALVQLWDLSKFPNIEAVFSIPGNFITAAVFNPNGSFVIIDSDIDFKQWEIKSCDKTLSLLEQLLIIKLRKNKNLLIDDSKALELLKTVIKKPELTPQLSKLIEAFLYRSEHPKEECQSGSQHDAESCKGNDTP